MVLGCRVLQGLEKVLKRKRQESQEKMQGNKDKTRMRLGTRINQEVFKKETVNHLLEWIHMLKVMRLLTIREQCSKKEIIHSITRSKQIME